MVYYGATVQDLTDTWTALAMRAVGVDPLARPAVPSRALLLGLAERHRDTLMAGRTHGQPGCADHLRASRPRRGPTRSAGTSTGCARARRGGWSASSPAASGRWPSSARPDALAVAAGSARELGLGDPGCRWLTARDRVAEFGTVLALVSGTLARIGNEVYSCSDPRSASCASRDRPGAVGSITMPHKRNPETQPSTSTRSPGWSAPRPGVLLEGMVQEHERDGRGWKAEWVALPEVVPAHRDRARPGRGLLDGPGGRRRGDGGATSAHGDYAASGAGAGGAGPLGWASTGRRTLLQRRSREARRRIAPATRR